MKKKIVIGSLLVLTLLLLMPSIPAVQQKTIDEGIKQEIQEKIDSITLDDLKDIKVLDNMKHPILYYIMEFLFNFQFARFLLVSLIASAFIDYDGYGNWSIKQPILFIVILMRAIWLFGILYLFDLFWFTIADKMGWNWFP